MEHGASDDVAAMKSVSLVTAVNEKYGDALTEQTLMPPLNGNDGTPPMSLFMKIKNVENAERRELLVLNDLNIDRAGDLNQLAETLPYVTHLDLSRNLFVCWNELCQIFARTPALKHCDLSYNYALGKSAIPEGSLLCWSTLNSLVLNATELSLHNVVQLLKAAPRLEELHVSFNDFSTGLYSTDNDAIFHSFPNIKLLHLNQCHIPSFKVLCSICRLFPCLETLFVPKNPICEIYSCEEPFIDIFSKLHSININKWLIVDWIDIDALKRLETLTVIRANGLPLFEQYNDNERRMLFIARLPNLQVLNGSVVNVTNREEAERFFIRHYMDMPIKPERYYELVKIHGCLNKLLDVDLSPKHYVEIRLVYEEGNKTENRRITLNQSVGEFKKSLQTFCNLPPNRMRLWYFDIELGHGFGIEELRYPGVMLHALRIADRDEFHIQAKPEYHVRSRKKTTGSTSSDQTPGTSPHK